jgi:SH3 domain-containing YSC84-like protein 1
MFLAVGGGSVDFQIGGSFTDVVMLFMNERALQSLLNDKFKMGADATVAAGPVGRNAAAGTDAKLNAEILSYSRRIRGLLPGQLGWRRRAGRLERRLRACMAPASPAGRS